MQFKTILSILFLFISVKLYCTAPENDSIPNNNRYSFGVIPSLAYDSDLGFKYGAVINLFDFGETKFPPHYKQYLLIKLTNTTKGTLNLQALLESETLFKKAKVLAEATYLKDKKLNFFGFNGTETVYDKGFTEPENSEFRNELFYTHRRNFLRLRFDVQKYLSVPEFSLLTGFTYNFFKIEPASEEQNKNSLNNLSSGFPQPTLFEDYNSWGIIQSEESGGGNIGLFSLGLIYDSRNDPCYCTNGKWLELVLLLSPDMLSAESFTKLIATYRQHKSILNDKITFSFRVSGQQKLSGNIPYYFIPNFYDSRLSQDGVGGAFNLRGAMRNRIAADGFVAGNFEIKAKILDFVSFKQTFSAFIVGFYDNAYVTQLYKVNMANIPSAELEINFNLGKQKVNHTFGPGFYLVFNKNNIVTANYGFSTNKQLGPGGLYVGSSLLF